MTEATTPLPVDQEPLLSADPLEPLPLLRRELHTGPSGLSAREAGRRLAVYGPNEVRRKARTSLGRELVRQLVHPLALLLWAAAAPAFVTGIPVWRADWRPGDPTGTGSPLHHAYITATTATFAGIVTCQVGTAFAARTDHAALRDIGLFTNPLLLAGIAFELAFTAALVYAPPLQGLFGTAALPLDVVALIATLPVLVWGTDELRRWVRRTHPLTKP
ncbi:cation transporting ATPase C-terminal domain-containing protein [Streptomyces sp. NBC_01343]|uniref:cation transporting ATPase C-terminal domain-containing protein n=1 Tax=Streptomyces sp. NBC_01343 TaxID=2903832 RepID=UPI002E0E5324|nr:cation transporting ATPase C-terminal domain-containing protein [Streptomyces sp. NBC_01343]